jgi:apolipoprotein N-acyltransferase
VQRWILALLPFALLGVFMHLLATPGEDSDLRYTLVQPLLKQSEINDASKFEEQFARIAAMTVPGQNQSRIVLWPESAIPDYLEDGYPERYYRQVTAGADPAFARQRIGRVIGPQSTLLTGVVNLNIGTRADGSQGAVSARNSVIALNGAGEIGASYAKAHLVPYGEYLPMRPLLEPLGLSRLVAGSIDYKPGPGPRTIDLGEHGKVGLQICYEIVFSGEVTDRANRPDFLFNPSNDGWFGSWGSPQFVGQSRMRAIEEGLPVIRSTTTGISAVIDANGIVRGAIDTGKADKLEGFVPAAKPPTLFARWGHWLTLGWAIVFLIAGLVLPRVLALTRARG